MQPLLPSKSQGSFRSLKRLQLFIFAFDLVEGKCSHMFFFCSFYRTFVFFCSQRVCSCLFACVFLHILPHLPVFCESCFRFKNGH